MHYRSLKSIQSDVFASKVNLKQLVEGYIQRIKDNAHLNAFLEIFESEALKKAEELDNRISNNEPVGKLAGMVIGLKDLISYKDHCLTGGSKILKGYNAKYSATVVERLLKEDAIIIGRQNCDEFGMGSANKNSAYGPTLNNIDNKVIAGGSSGGSAVAVQANLCLVSLGSDTGGSVRQPASLNGIIGLKPTYSLVSRHGLAAYASSFDIIGILSNTIEDNKLVLEVISGKDEFDSTSSTKSFKRNSEPISAKKFAYIKQAVESEGLSNEVKTQFLFKLKKLKQEGHTVEEIDFPLLKFLLPTYYIITMAEASSNLARYDGVRYGHSEKSENNLSSLYTKTRTTGFGKEVKRRVMLGSFILSAGYYDAYFKKAQSVRRLIRNQTKELFNTYDFIISPTAPGPAYAADKKQSSPIEEYLQDTYTVHASLAGLPAISVPLGKTKANLPTGIQLIGNDFEENALYTFGNYLLTL